MTKRIILCADDYGQNTAISQAIIDLLKKKHLSATSCMTNSYYWPSHAKWLEPFKQTADIGLHFNLTEGEPLSKEIGPTFPRFPVLMTKAFLKQLNQKAIENELHHQLDRFKSALGKEPDYIDGHQHIHQFPVIRDALLNVYRERLQNSGCYIRSVYSTQLFRGVKHFIIQFTGAYPLRKELMKAKIPFNSSFSGIYSFSQASRYAEFFPKFLTEIQDQGIIMCHPGLNQQNQDDVIGKARFCEFNYLSSEKFVTDCEKKQVTIGRYNTII